MFHNIIFLQLAQLSEAVVLEHWWFGREKHRGAHPSCMWVHSLPHSTCSIPPRSGSIHMEVYCEAAQQCIWLLRPTPAGYRRSQGCL